jgi:ABC-2 type transport system ATP-binding protein
LQKGNLVKQGNVSELLQESEQIELGMSQAEELEKAQHILQQAQERGATWLGRMRIETNRKGLPILMIDARGQHSAEINAILAHNNLFAAEIHPREGSLEDLYLKAIASQESAHIGMEALAESPNQADIDAEISSSGKGSSK